MTLKSKHSLLLYMHILTGSALGGFVYGEGLREIPEFTAAVQYVLFPLTGIIGVIRWKFMKIRKVLKLKDC